MVLGDALTRLERFDGAGRAPNVEEGCEECKSEEEEDAAAGLEPKGPGVETESLGPTEGWSRVV